MGGIGILRNPIRGITRLLLMEIRLPLPLLRIGAFLSDTVILVALEFVVPGMRDLRFALDKWQWAQLNSLVAAGHPAPLLTVATVFVGLIPYTLPVLSTFLFRAVYLLVCLGLFGRPVGMRDLSLRLEDTDGRAASRRRTAAWGLCSILSALPVYAGYLPLLAGRPALHDRLVGVRMTVDR